MGDVAARPTKNRGVLTPLSLRGLRWLSFGLPVVLLIGFDYVRHFIFPFILFHDWPGFVVLWGGTMAGAFVMSRVVFGVIEKMQRENLQRNSELADLNQAAKYQADQLKALHKASMALTAELSLEAVLQNVVDLSRELIKAQYAVLTIYQEGEMQRLITSGLSARESETIPKIRRGLGLMASLPDQKKPLRVGDIRSHPLFKGFPPNHPEMRTFLGVPIVAKGRVIGNLRLTNKAGAAGFTQQDEDIVVMLAAQAAIAIQNAQLHKQDQALAVLRERERIAQDMHDGIIQDIYAIGLGLEQCIERVEEGGSVPARLSSAVDSLNDIIKNIRNYIFALEPTDLQGRDLTAGLRNVAQEFRVNSLVDAELIVQDDVNAIFSPEQAGQVLQIAREALANVLKHAKASAVTIEATSLDGRFELAVTDNGKGFDIFRTTTSGLGLHNMADRARALGGDATITSEGNKGSTVRLVVPIKARENVLT